MIRHVKLSTFYRPASHRKLIGYVDDSSVSKEIGRIWIMKTCQGHFRYARIAVEVGQEMPPTCSASSVRKIDGGFTRYVVLV
ncbi:hypothetical protein SRABI110_05028 [Pseudomonas carnis]|uniref:Uncharacterized protein n=1 Tax=Pseudomonas fluorescens TaxID=294 RepID=A0A109KEF0_PSEFL|nr:hypothetical protein PFL603g_06493 [Pseudomonas fluorescens]CAH0303820.1 hypothetical protein SRABI08_04607 [Pseudomonas carnis]CAH0310203.1 hypothetical protein SRABI110_05028 [Pseudomonas carnis]